LAGRHGIKKKGELKMDAIEWAKSQNKRFRKLKNGSVQIQGRTRIGSGASIGSDVSIGSDARIGSDASIGSVIE
jgi:NDP-sugar pyrophosphorylase family protein